MNQRVKLSKHGRLGALPACLLFLARWREKLRSWRHFHPRRKWAAAAGEATRPATCRGMESVPANGGGTGTTAPRVHVGVVVLSRPQPSARGRAEQDASDVEGCCCATPWWPCLCVFSHEAERASKRSQWRHGWCPAGARFNRLQGMWSKNFPKYCKAVACIWLQAYDDKTKLVLNAVFIIAELLKSSECFVHNCRVTIDVEKSSV